MAIAIRDIPNYCKDLLTQIEDVSGSSLRIEEREALEFDSELKLAGKDRIYHELMYRSTYKAHLEHFIVNSAYKILRFWAAKVEDRYVPMSEARILPARPHKELCSNLGLPEQNEHVSMISKFIYTGITRQLTSFPTDIRVENDIFSLPEHRSRQLHYLNTQVRDFLPTLDESLLEMLPLEQYRASTAMNIAFAEEAARLSGVVPDPLVRNHNSRGLAERLLHQLYLISEPGHLGDRLLTDAWAKELDMANWYMWERYETLPST